MVTNPDSPESPTTTKADIMEALRTTEYKAADGARALFTGSGSGAMRRNVLYVTVVLFIVAGLPMAALLPLLLLALTDAVIV